MTEFSPKKLSRKLGNHQPITQPAPESMHDCDRGAPLHQSAAGALSRNSLLTAPTNCLTPAGTTSGNMNLSRKPSKLAGWALLFILCALFASPGWAVPEYDWIVRLPKSDRISTPPPGKALVNFHRLGKMKKLTYSLFDPAGKFLADIPPKGQFQHVCDPGEHVYFGWLVASTISVIKADVAAGKVYDILLDESDLKLSPLLRDDPRRAKLSDWESVEDPVTLKRIDRVVESENRAQPKVAKIREDFLDGPKAGQVLVLRKEDCR
jgi:hypothetical protein